MVMVTVCLIFMYNISFLPAQNLVGFGHMMRHSTIFSWHTMQNTVDIQRQIQMSGKKSENVMRFAVKNQTADVG